MESNTLSPRLADVFDPGGAINCNNAAQIISDMRRTIADAEQDNARIDEKLRTEKDQNEINALTERRTRNDRAIVVARRMIRRVTDKCGSNLASVPSNRAEGNDTRMSPTEAKRKIAERRADDKFVSTLMDSLHPDNKTAKEEMHKLYRIAYPEPKKKKAPRGPF